MKVCILQSEEHPVLFEHFDVIVANLKALGISCHWAHEPPEDSSEQYLMIAHNIKGDLEFVPNRYLLGDRTINRQERLVLAMEVGAPVARWIAPVGPDAVSGFSEEVGADSLVFKYDISSRREAVTLLHADEPLPQDTSPNADVVMELLTGDPTTYKVDVFFDTIVGAYALPTRPIGSPDFLESSPRSKPFVLPRETAEACRRVGTKLLSYGAGYISIDLMRKDSGFEIIEINTCEVGLRGTWPRWSSYVTNYSAAIKSLLASGTRIPTMEESSNITDLLRADRAMSLKHPTDGQNG